MEQLNLQLLIFTQFIFSLLIGLGILLLVWRRNKSLGQGREEATFETLHLANRTLPYLRQGLSRQTAAKTAELIYKYTQAAAVSITSSEEVLAFVGIGGAAEHHRENNSSNLQISREVIHSGRTQVAHGKAQLGCTLPVGVCSLTSVVVSPLKLQKKPVGCLLLYYTDSAPLSVGKIKIAAGLAQLMSTQMELSELDRKTERLAKAELQALQSQISPHFVYNTLNTIASFIRTRPETARELIVQFADFTRRSFKKHGEYTTFAEELEYIHQYLAFEKARFGEKLSVVYRVDPQILPTVVPVLILQPLVENAVRHGIGKKIGPGHVSIVAEDQGDECFICVSDDGIGMDEIQVEEVLKQRQGTQYGVGLSNVNERLKSIYGLEHALHIQTKPQEGTSICFRVPKFRSGVIV
jgi:two-component system LytT family sensor kinase